MRSTRAMGLLLVILGCGADDSQELPTSVDEEDFAEFLAIEDCSDAFDCRCPDVPWRDRSDCLEQQRAFRADQSAVARANGLTYDPECVAETIYRARDLACEVELTPDATALQLEAAACPEPCRPYYGDKRNGEACSRFGFTVPVDDCSQRLLCSDEGVCVPICPTAPSALGEACLDENEQAGPCEVGTFCAPSSGTCAVLPTMGESCETLCAPGAWCDRAPDPPVCVATLGEGEPCVLGESCESGTCENGQCTQPRALVCP